MFFVQNACWRVYYNKGICRQNHQSPEGLVFHQKTPLLARFWALKTKASMDVYRAQTFRHSCPYTGTSAVETDAFLLHSQDFDPGEECGALGAGTCWSFQGLPSSRLMESFNRSDVQVIHTWIIVEIWWNSVKYIRILCTQIRFDYCRLDSTHENR